MYKHWEDEVSFSDFIVSHLLSWRSVRIQRRVLYELVKKRRHKNQQIFNNNLHRLKNKGVISFDSKKNVVINKKELQSYVSFKNMNVKPTGEIQVLVLFDIPEKKRKVRNWLRLQLKLWNFKMIQQSAWLGGRSITERIFRPLKSIRYKKMRKSF